MYSHYKSLISIRNSSKVLTLGGISNSQFEADDVISFYRHYEGDTITVVHNLSGSAKTFHFEGDLVFESNAFQKGSEFEIGPYGTIVVD